MHKNLKTIGEFGLIDRISSMFEVPSDVCGIGDDCAVIPQGNGKDLLVSTDLLVEGIHFLRGAITAELLGRKSVAVNLSDVAAMGGCPTGTFLSIALPEDVDVEWMEGFMRGYHAISSEYGVPLLGGDTTSSLSGICINVAVIGECPSGRAKMRSAAKPGDLICVTGTLGDSAGGLQMILSGIPSEMYPHLIDRHLNPTPRVKEGLELSGCGGVHAMMDISDGIGSDLRHILKASACGAVVDVAAIPVSSELKAFCETYARDFLELSAGGGEDYELLFTLDPGYISEVRIPFSVIGEIVSGSSVEWKGTNKELIGFKHF